jgi:hypothetical protein
VILERFKARGRGKEEGNRDLVRWKDAADEDEAMSRRRHDDVLPEAKAKLLQDAVQTL